MDGESKMLSRNANSPVFWLSCMELGEWCDLKLEKWIKARSHWALCVLLRILDLRAVGVIERVYIRIRCVFLEGGERI